MGKGKRSVEQKDTKQERQKCKIKPETGGRNE